jgi:Mn-dependent DtxR family transcriptional regulator
MTGASQYLVVLYIVERETGGPVSSGSVASAVDRSPAAATEMLQRLADRGLVTYEPYEGARLTARGRATAEELYETYTVLAQFFEEVLEITDPQAEAMRLAGTVSPTVADRLASTLLSGTEPTTDDLESLPTGGSE